MDVFINKAGKFLPNEPVSNNDMEAYLGMVDGKPSKARAIILRRNGIKQRYYALDKEGNTTHTNPQMAAKAIRSLFSDSLSLDDIDLLSCGTSTPSTRRACSWARCWPRRCFPAIPTAASKPTANCWRSDRLRR